MPPDKEFFPVAGRFFFVELVFDKSFAIDELKQEFLNTRSVTNQAFYVLTKYDI
jgi:hypothetical protein